MTCPDVVGYDCETQRALAVELRGLKVAPSVVADYHVMRNQARRCAGKPVPPAPQCKK